MSEEQNKSAETAEDSDPIISTDYYGEARINDKNIRHNDDGTFDIVDKNGKVLASGKKEEFEVKLSLDARSVPYLTGGKNKQANLEIHNAICDFLKTEAAEKLFSTIRENVNATSKLAKENIVAVFRQLMFDNFHMCKQYKDGRKDWINKTSDEERDYLDKMNRAELDEHYE